MTYNQTLDYLFTKLPMYHRIGFAAYKADLDNTIKLCNLLGNPQNSFKSIHVAGTNGKGSVSHMLASLLQEKGFKVGLYTSPHLQDFRERIRVNGVMIPKSYVSGFVHDYKKDFDLLRLSFFEMTVGLAFHYFKKKKVDIAVVEVGLGGRLDSTNIITPVLSVITNISFDHTQFLGETLEKIALEKAGIIKPGVPVVIGETQEGIKDIFIKKAEASGSEITFADEDLYVSSFENYQFISDQPFYSPQRRKDAKSLGTLASSRLRNVKQKENTEFFTKLSTINPVRNFDVYQNNLPLFKRLESPLLGNYQQKNILTVLSACQKLKKAGISIHEEQIRNGIRNVIRNTGLKGRWQVLSRKPLTICDTGHNEGGLTEVLAQIRETPYDHLHFVFGVVNDKLIDHILMMLPKDATYYFCKANIPRGLDQDELRTKAQLTGLTGFSYPSVTDALNAAKENASCNDLIFIGGSTFVVAEVVS
jgi:dihydrofolate synthase / folylpolyglutamate synthase